MEDDLRKLLEDTILTVSPSTPIKEVVRRMKDETSSCVLVVDEENLAGIFTEHDVLCKLASADSQVFDAPISELMTPNPESLKETDSVAAARKIVEDEFKAREEQKT